MYKSPPLHNNLALFFKKKINPLAFFFSNDDSPEVLLNSTTIFVLFFFFLFQDAFFNFSFDDSLLLLDCKVFFLFYLRSFKSYIFI
jgi:hypothetical protein